MPKPASQPPPRPPVAEEVADVPGATRERVRLALIELAKRKEKVTIRALRIEAACDQNAASRVLRAHQAGRMPPLFQPWDDTAQPGGARAAQGAPAKQAGDGGLAERINAAQTHDDLLAAGKAIATALMGGTVAPDVAAKLTNLLTEMRQSVKGRSQEPKESVDSILPVTEEARPLVEAFEGIVDDEARARVLELVLAAAEEDRRRRPSLDTGGAQA